MDRFRELTVFTAVAEQGAFNAAARLLGMSPAAVTRAVTALETRLGVLLFTRTTRKVSLTQAGERLQADAARILAELDAAEASATGLHAAVRGVLRVTAPVMFGQRFLAPVMRDFLDRNPEVGVEARFLDRSIDLIEEGVDVALRIGDLPDSTYTARRVGAVRRVMVASPALLSRHPVPKTPDELAEIPVIGTGQLSGAHAWEFAARGMRRSVRIAPRLVVNTVQAALDAALAGWGGARLLSYQAADALRDGRLVELLGPFEDRAMPINLVHHEGMRASAKLRSFLDHATDALRAERAHFEARAPHFES